MCDLIPSVPEFPGPEDAEELLNHIEELLDKTYDMCLTVVMFLALLLGAYFLFRIWDRRSR